MTNDLLATLILVLTLHVSTPAQQATIGDTEFFGTTGVDIQKLRSSLPFHAGDLLSGDSIPDLKSRVSKYIKESTGSEPTDVAPVCCNQQGQWLVYIGLRGQNFKNFNYNPAPTGTARLPIEIVNIYGQAMDLLFESIQNKATEDQSQGFALSTYPPLRAKQLAMREYAIHNASLIRDVLAESAQSEQRSVAAQLLGYANQDEKQLAALGKASRDSNEYVRNNAVRALAVLASQNHFRSTINANSFVEMLNSGIWTDRNKAAYLISVLTTSRENRLLALLRKQASNSLVEMARWRESGHADSARLILGRIAGMNENNLKQLIATKQVDAIINAFERSRTQK